MALILATGFDKSTVLTDEFTSITDSAHFDIGAYGRNGTNGFRWTGLGGLTSPGVHINLGGQVTTIIASFGFNPVSDGNGKAFIGFSDNGTGQAEIRRNTDGTCTLTGTASTFYLPTNEYHHVAVKCTIGNSTGSWVVQVDGAQVLSVTGIDTQNTANAYATTVYLGFGANPAGTFYWDDLIVMDTSGSTFNNFIGDKRVIEQLPTSDGSVAQFTPSTGTALWAMVDEASPDGDTTYIEDSTVGHIARFGFPSLPITSGQVLCSDVLWYGRKTDAGTRVLRGNVKSGGVVGTGSNVAVASNYAYSRGHFELDPNTSAAWTIAAVNAAEHGAEVVS